MISMSVGRQAGDVWSVIRDNPIALAIVACEIGFWVLLGLGLLVRYVFRARRLSTVLLIGVPVVDVVLLVVTALDLRRGAEVTAFHGLAAIYLGISVALGHRMVRWADRWFAYRFAGGPRPTKPPKSGPARSAHEWKLFGLVVLGGLLAAAVLLALGQFATVNQAQRDALLARIPLIGVVLGVWFVAGPLWVSFSGDDGDRGGEAGGDRGGNAGTAASGTDRRGDKAPGGRRTSSGAPRD